MSASTTSSPVLEPSAGTGGSVEAVVVVGTIVVGVASAVVLSASPMVVATVVSTAVLSPSSDPLIEPTTATNTTRATIVHNRQRWYQRFDGAGSGGDVGSVMRSSQLAAPAYDQTG
jgi:hypothetical protein